MFSVISMNTSAVKEEKEKKWMEKKWKNIFITQNLEDEFHYWVSLLLRSTAFCLSSLRCLNSALSQSHLHIYFTSSTIHLCVHMLEVEKRETKANLNFHRRHSEKASVGGMHDIQQHERERWASVFCAEFDSGK